MLPEIRFFCGDPTPCQQKSPNKIKYTLFLTRTSQNRNISSYLYKLCTFSQKICKVKAFFMQHLQNIDITTKLVSFPPLMRMRSSHYPGRQWTDSPHCSSGSPRYMEGSLTRSRWYKDSNIIIPPYPCGLLLPDGRSFIVYSMVTLSLESAATLRDADGSMSLITMDPDFSICSRGTCSV